MDMSKVRAMSVEDRRKELHGLLREQFNLRMQRATGQLANHVRLRQLRRDIARVLTVEREQSRAEK